MSRRAASRSGSPSFALPDFLRQRRCQRGDDGARRHVRQRLQRDERSQHVLRVRALVCAAARPLPPPRLRPRRHVERVDRLGTREVRGIPGEVKRDAFAFRDRERRRCRAALRAHLHGRTHADRVRPGHGEDALVDPADRRDEAAVVESRPDLHLHGYPASQAFDDPDDVVLAQRHAVHQADEAVVRLEVGLQHQRARPVPPLDAARLARRRDLPVAVGIGTEQCGEERGGVESRRTQPVDRPVLAHERRGLGVPNQSVVFNAQSHCVPSSVLGDLGRPAVAHHVPSGRTAPPAIPCVGVEAVHEPGTGSARGAAVAPALGRRRDVKPGQPRARERTRGALLGRDEQLLEKDAGRGISLDAPAAVDGHPEVTLGIHRHAVGRADILGHDDQDPGCRRRSCPVRHRRRTRG